MGAASWWLFRWKNINGFPCNLDARIRGKRGPRGRRNVANEAFARIKIDQLLKDADWSLADGRSVRFEYPLDDGGRADYALFDRQGRPLAVLEAKSTSVNLSAGEAQGTPISAASRLCSARTISR